MRKSRWRSASAWRSEGCGAKPSTAGKKRSKSIRLTRLRSTTSRSRTSTKASSTRRGKRTKKRSSSSPTISRFGRTLSSSRKSMTARVPATRRANSLALVSTAALLAAVAVACGPSYFEIPIETPIRAKMDVSPFQRVLVAGFVAGGTDDVDTNLETVRLLRSQLRSKSSLRVIDADVMPLLEIAQDQSRPAGEAPETQAAGGPEGSGAARPSGDVTALPKQIREERDLEPYERLFANTAYW